MRARIHARAPAIVTLPFDRLAARLRIECSLRGHFLARVGARTRAAMVVARCGSSGLRREFAPVRPSARPLACSPSSPQYASCRARASSLQNSSARLSAANACRRERARATVARSDGGAQPHEPPPPLAHVESASAYCLRVLRSFTKFCVA